MKKFSRKMFFALLMTAIMLVMAMPAFAAKKEKYQNIDKIETVEVNYTKSNDLVLNGWYEKKLESGRTVKMYFPEIAQCRAYFTIVAAPAGVTNVQAWAKEMGYTQKMADRGEVLVVLTADKKWGKLADENAYVTEAMSFVASGKNAAGLALFTNYSTFYLVGYEGGCAPLELWSAQNPILVGSQVFINGKSAGKKALTKAGKVIYDGTNTGGYDPGIADLDEFEKVLAEHGYAGKAITKSEVPVPTWFVNYKEDSYSLSYWKSANDCSTKNSGSKTNKVYWQKKNSDAFQTEYANACTTAKHGISQVKVSALKKVKLDSVCSFLYHYTRYNVPFAYSNHLSERMDYTSVRVAAQKAAQKAKYLTKKQFVAYESPITSDLGATYDGYYILARKSGKVGKGTIESGIISFSDDNTDGVMDAREYLMYIPDSAKGKKAPVVMQYPGATQSVSVGFDSTQWWRVADDEGVIIVIISEAYNNGIALTWKNSDMATIAVQDILKNKVDGKMADIDWSAIYGSGHSMGSWQVQDAVHKHPDFFAAVASTSFCSRAEGGAYQAVPTMLVCGQSDLPFLMKDLWTSASMKSWFEYLADADNLKVDEATRDNCDEKVEGAVRTWSYTWNNQDEIPMVKWCETFIREHNCHPSEVPMAWDFLKNYKKTADGRYYYGKGKAEKIEGNKQLPYDMDNVVSIQSYTDGTIYGEGLVKVEVTYKKGVDITGLTPEDYILEDRGSANPAFGQIKIDSVTVKGRVATLTINQDTDATATNAFIYTGDNKEGSRSRNSYGIFTTTAAWYRDTEGTLYFGKDDEDEYENNTTGMGWWCRPCLELKLRHAGEPAEDAECLADDKGNYNAASKWNENIDANFCEGGFLSFEEAGIEIPSTSADIPEIGDEFVKGHIYVPENYDGKTAVPLVVTIQGQNISYWKIADGSNNFGCSAMFDVSTTSWKGKGAIVVNIADRSSFGISKDTGYDYVTDDCRVIKYMLENYNVDPKKIILQGNSRSTMASSTIIKALAGNPYTIDQEAPTWGSSERDHMLDKEEFDFTIGTYICQNGMAGGQGIWKQADWDAIAATGLRVWCFDSEQDFNNIDYLNNLADSYRALGVSEEWIAENLRISCYPSELFYYWGESDHSVTRINSWYFNDEVYYGSNVHVENAELVYDKKLEPGDTYTVQCRGKDRTETGLNTKEGHEYVVYPEKYQVWALENVAANLDGVAAPCYDHSDALQLPMTGYFYKTLTYGESSRGVYVYIPEDASVRPYFYVLALPEGADVTTFLTENGWFDVADQRGECLFVIQSDKYGDAEEEMAFMTKAMSWLNAPKADAADPDHEKNVNYWSAFGEWYFVGYGEGAATLEAWAAKNPIYVIAQAYVDGASVGAEYLTAVGAEQYPVGTNGYDITEDVRTRLGDENMIKRGQVPVPTLFAGSNNSASVKYWKNASSVAKKAVADPEFGKVYVQNADKWQTQYAGNISKIAVAEKADTSVIMDFLLTYTRYDNTSVYGNSLMRRVNYADVVVAAHQSPERYAEKKITCPDGQTGTMICTIVEVEGEWREFLAYIPDSAAVLQKDGAPIITVWAGGSQTNIIYFDSTCWWETANANGVALILPDEYYNTSVAVTPKNVYQEYDKAIELLTAWEADGKFDFDFTRIYSTGQSMGSMESQRFAQSNPEYYAAVASTSFYQDYPDEHSGNPIPTYLINGEGNGTADTGTMWDDRQNRADDWAAYFLTVDGFGYIPAEYDEDGNVTKFGAPATAPTTYTVTGPYDRFQTWTWCEGNIPLVQYTNSLYRPHNCLTSETPMEWDFLEHYRRLEDGTCIYSASAFKADDAQVIYFGQEGAHIRDFDSITTNLDYDYTQAAQLPLNGWFTKTVSEGRTMKMYISEEASVRSYFTVVAVPNGVDTEEFLVQEGWFDVMDQKGEVLVVLEPGKNGWGKAKKEIDYVNAAMGFVRGTRNNHGVPVFSTFGEFYFVGYGEGAAPLEYYAAQNPILVIAQEYIGGKSAGSKALDKVSSTLYDGKSSNGDITEVLDETIKAVGITGKVAPKDLAVPTVLADYTGSEDHWKAANNCRAKANKSGVYYQDINAANYSTDYANSVRKEEGKKYGLSQVKVTKAGAKAAEIYAYLAQWTRYDTTFAYSNALATRLDYTEARVAAQQAAKDGEVIQVLSDGTEILAQSDVQIAGHGTVQVGVIAFADNSGDGKNDPREYIMYVPESVGQDAPVLFVYPGNSQTDSIFMDSTLWWQVADKEGFVFAIVCETYSSNATVISHANSDLFYGSLVTIMNEQVDGVYCDLDMDRLYCTGQSAGSIATQGFAMTDPDFFAAVASTSAIPVPKDLPGAENYDKVMITSKDPAYKAIPTMVISGQMDIGDLAKGFASDYLQIWGNYMLKANGIEATFAADTASAVTYVDSRHAELYTWNNAQGIPMVEWSQCLLRPHNCYPSSMPILWDYMKHFSKDENGVRTYSVSAFAEDDAVVIAE